MKRTIILLTLTLFALCQQCIGFAPVQLQRKRKLQSTQQNHDRLSISPVYALKNEDTTYPQSNNPILDLVCDGKLSESMGGDSQTISRRMFSSRSFGAVTTSVFTSSVLLLNPEKVSAGIDVSSLKTLPIEGDASGAALRMQQLQTTDATAKRDDSIVELDSGVRYRQSNPGSAPGGRNRAIRNGVSKGFNVGAIIAITTPEGLPIYSTKVDNDSNELSWKVGSGDFPRGAEEGMMGMRLGSTRRIEVPSQMIFASRNLGVLPEATTEVGRERYEAAFRSGDAKLVFTVRVTGINTGDGRM